jgi:hypothetical protein
MHIPTDFELRAFVRNLRQLAQEWRYAAQSYEAKPDYQAALQFGANQLLERLPIEPCSHDELLIALDAAQSLQSEYREVQGSAWQRMASDLYTEIVRVRRLR